MSRATATVLLVLGAVLVAIAWDRWFRADPPLPAPSDAGVPVGVEPRPDGPHGPVGDAAAAAVRVWIEVEETARLLPPPSPAIVVTQFGAVVAAAAEVVAGDSEAGPDGAEPNGPALVAVHLGGAVYYRRCERAAGEGLRVDFGVERALSGRVVDSTARPIAGARVWFGGAPVQQATTDDDGRFTVAVPASAGVPVVVRAEGKAWKCAFVEVTAQRGAEVPFVLADEAQLQIQAVGTEGSVRGAHAWVVDTDPTGTESSAWPMFAQGLLCEAPIDADGRAVVRGLPRGTAVGVALIGPALGCTRAKAVRLQGASTRVDVAAPPLPTVSGVVVDGLGQPQAGVGVWCRVDGAQVRKAGRGGALLPVALSAPGVPVGTTAADGTFSLALPSGREYRFGALARSGSRVDRSLRPPWREPVRLVLPAEVQAAVELLVPPPTDGMAWALRVDPGTGGRFESVAADVPARVPFDHAAVVDLRVRVGDGDVWSAPRSVRDFVLSAPTQLPDELLRR